MKPIACVSVLLVAWTFPGPGFAQMRDVDVRYISDNCFFALQFDIQKLMALQKMGDKDVAKLAEMIKKNTQMDIRRMKTFTIQFCEAEGGEGFDDDIVGVAITFTEPVDPEKIVATLGPPFEKVEEDGLDFYRPEGGFGPTIHFGDGKKALLIGLEPTVKKMAGKKSGQSRVAALMKSADPNGELKGAFVAGETYQTFLEMISDEIPVSPFNIAKVFGEAKEAVFSGNVRSSTPILIQGTCKSAEGAETLAKKIKFLIDLGKSTIPIGKESIQAQLKELDGKELSGFEKFNYLNLKMSLQGLELSEKILGASHATSADKKVAVKVKMMGGFKDVVPMIVKMMSAQFVAIDELRQGLDEPPIIEDDF